MSRYSAVDDAAIRRQVDADMARFHLSVQRSLIEMERREQFWRGVGVIIGGILVVLANRKGRTE